MTPQAQVQLHAIVEGRVQGVGFRFFVVDRAEELGLSGWVRNTYDEKVEVLAEGSRDLLEKLLEALRHGPRSAFVTQVSQEWLPATGEWHNFSVRPTI